MGAEYVARSGRRSAIHKSPIVTLIEVTFEHCLRPFDNYRPILISQLHIVQCFDLFTNLNDFQSISLP